MEPAREEFAKVSTDRPFEFIFKRLWNSFMIAFFKGNVYRVLSHKQVRSAQHNLGRLLRRFLDAITLMLIAMYRAVGSLWLSGSCRFEPSCSVYAQEAVERYGFWIGGRLAAIRLFRCRPGGPFGYDPVPCCPSHASSRATAETAKP